MDRPLNTFSRKDRLSKKIIFSWFWLSQKASYSTFKVLSKERLPQVIWKFFFVTSISASSHRILMTTIWKTYIRAALKGCKIIFLISADFTHLWYPECSTCKFPQNRTGMHFFQKILKIKPYTFPMKNPILGIENPCLGPLFKRISFFKKILSQNLDFCILDFYDIFWLASEVVKYDFLSRAVTFWKWL